MQGEHKLDLVAAGFSRSEKHDCAYLQHVEKGVDRHGEMAGPLAGESCKACMCAFPGGREFCARSPGSFWWLQSCLCIASVQRRAPIGVAGILRMIRLDRSSVAIDLATFFRYMLSDLSAQIASDAGTGNSTGILNGGAEARRRLNKARDEVCANLETMTRWVAGSAHRFH